MLYFAPWKTTVVTLVILIGLLFTLPNFVPESVRLDANGEPKGVFTVLPHKTINLGLDLRGGSHLVFQVDMEEVRQERLENLQDDARSALREDPPILIAGSPAVVEGQVIVRLSRPDDMDRALERLEELNEPITTAAGGQGMTQTLTINQGDDDRTIRLGITEAALDAVRQRTVTQSIEVIRRRVDSTGTTEPNIARQGEDRVLVQVPGESDPQRIIDLVGTTARLTFHMVEEGVTINPDGTGRTPPGVMILPSERSSEPYLAVQRRALVTGEQLVNAGQAFDQNGQPAVSFRFNTSGARSFAEATTQNRGRRFAIVLDDTIISAP
jgi:preprotein translocase subunit SecD